MNKEVYWGLVFIGILLEVIIDLKEVFSLFAGLFLVSQNMFVVVYVSCLTYLVNSMP